MHWNRKCLGKSARFFPLCPSSGPHLDNDFPVGFGSVQLWLQLPEKINQNMQHESRICWDSSVELYLFLCIWFNLLITLLVPVNGSSKVSMLYFFLSPVNKNNLSWHLLVLLMGQNVQLQTVEKLKDVTRYLVRIVVRQCEVHTSERIRRSMQLYTVYSRMWGEEVCLFLFWWFTCG